MPKDKSGNISLIDLVEAGLLRGTTRAVLDRNIKETFEKAGKRAPSAAKINEAYAQAVDRWIADAETDEQAIYAYHVRVRKHLYQRSYTINDFKTCMAIMNDLAKLQNQYSKEKGGDKSAKRRGLAGQLRSIREVS